jgi:hypothetical protein
MVKGFKGESCAEAIRESIGTKESVRFSELFRRVKERGGWKNETIWQHLMGLVVNLPLARCHWRTMQPFLFVGPDGQYQIYDPSVHPAVLE